MFIRTSDGKNLVNVMQVKKFSVKSNEDLDFKAYGVYADDVEIAGFREEDSAIDFITAISNKINRDTILGKVFESNTFIGGRGEKQYYSVEEIISEQFCEKFGSNEVV